MTLKNACVIKRTNGWTMGKLRGKSIRSIWYAVPISGGKMCEGLNFIAERREQKPK